MRHNPNIENLNRLAEAIENLTYVDMLYAAKFLADELIEAGTEPPATQHIAGALIDFAAKVRPHV